MSICIHAYLEPNLWACLQTFRGRDKSMALVAFCHGKNHWKTSNYWKKKLHSAFSAHVGSYGSCKDPRWNFRRAFAVCFFMFFRLTHAFPLAQPFQILHTPRNNGMNMILPEKTFFHDPRCSRQLFRNLMVITIMLGGYFFKQIKAYTFDCCM